MRPDVVNGLVAEALAVLHVLLLAAALYAFARNVVEFYALLVGGGQFGDQLASAFERDLDLARLVQASGGDGERIVLDIPVEGGEYGVVHAFAVFERHISVFGFDGYENIVIFADTGFYKEAGACNDCGSYGIYYVRYVHIRCVSYIKRGPVRSP